MAELALAKYSSANYDGHFSSTRAKKNEGGGSPNIPGYCLITLRMRRRLWIFLFLIWPASTSHLDPGLLACRRLHSEAMPCAVERWGRPFWVRLRSSTLTMKRKTASKALLAELPLRATSVGKATMGQESSTFSKCWQER